MEDLLKKITSIVDQFAQEEIGNKLSQFAMIALKEMILNEIKNYKSVKNEVIKGDFKK